MPFSSIDMEQYLTQHQITGLTRDYIHRAATGLSRDVGAARATSQIVEYQSKKMGVTVNTESRTAEYVYALQLEFDRSVIAYFEQPPKVEVDRMTVRGHRSRVPYHPDFLLLRQDGPCVIQVKHVDKLDSLVATRREDWVKLPDGSYQDLPAQRALEDLKLPHVVAPIDRGDQQTSSNIALMLRSLRCPIEVGGLEARVHDLLSRHTILSLESIAEKTRNDDYTPLIYLIANNRLYTDISRFSLTHPATCFVGLDVESLQDEVVRAWKEIQESRLSHQTAKISQHVLPIAKHLRKGIAAASALADGRSDRTARRWKSKLREAGASASQIAVLSRGYQRRGNRNPKRLEEMSFARDYIGREWGSAKQLSQATLFRHYKCAAEEAHPSSRPISKTAFYGLLRQMKCGLAFARGGNRATNASQPPSAIQDRALVPERPYELGTCDHYLCDISCVVLDANGRSYAMQPWLTVLRDVYTTSVLAFWLQLKAPCKRSVALVIRQCVRAHSILPERIVVDHGSDFRSNYFSELMAHCGVDLMFRPTGHPRYGSEAERFFGQFKSLWLSGRQGNRTDVREIRSLSGSHRPEKLACISLLDLWDDLRKFCDWLDSYTPDSAMVSPAQRLARGMAKYSCSGVPVCYDERFIIATAFDEARYALDPQRGLHIGPRHYWHPDLAREKSRRVTARMDPEDPYRVYALTNGMWVPCHSSSETSFTQKPDLERAVEGAIQLTAKEARTQVREDADRALSQALNARSASQSQLLPDHGRPSSDEGAAVSSPREDDLFSQVANGDIPDIMEEAWT